MAPICRHAKGYGRALRPSSKRTKILLIIGFSRHRRHAGHGVCYNIVPRAHGCPGESRRFAARLVASLPKNQEDQTLVELERSGTRVSEAQTPMLNRPIEPAAKKFFKRSRTMRVMIATALFLVVSFNSPPTLPSISDSRPEPPSPEEIYLLEEVAEWVLGKPLSEEFSAFTEADVVAAVRSRPRSFELFRRYSGASSRWDLVQSLPYGNLIRSTAVRYQVDSLLLASMVEAESAFNPYAISPQGALGLMQIMPETANPYSVDDLLDPAVNIDLGARYIARLLREFDGDVALALAGYNSGPGNVRRFGGMPPFRETRDYVDRVLSRYVEHHRDIWQSSGDQDFLF